MMLDPARVSKSELGMWCGGDGEFIQIPVIEIQRRQMEADISGAESDSGSKAESGPKPKLSAQDQQMRARVAQDPTVAFAEMARTLKLLGDDLIGPGALDEVTEKVLEAAGGSSGAYEQGKEGIGGTSDLIGVIDAKTIEKFRKNGQLETTVGLFKVDSFTFQKVENIYKVVNLNRKRSDEDYKTFLERRLALLEWPSPEDVEGYSDTYGLVVDAWLKNNTRGNWMGDIEMGGEIRDYQQVIREVGRVCNIYSLETEKHTPESVTKNYG